MSMGRAHMCRVDLGQWPTQTDLLRSTSFRLNQLPTESMYLKQSKPDQLIVNNMITTDREKGVK